MTDLGRSTPEVETPVNPYSLLEAVNHSSDTAHTGWLIFLAIMTYLMIAVAGVTHTDLLLQIPVELPILQVKIQLTQFFQFATVVLVLMHLGLISQLVLLAKETLEFDHAVRLLEITDQRTHPLRLELNNFFFVQAIAGPQRSMIMSGFLHGMSWLTLVVLPVVLLLYVQVVFLPYHDIKITWTHRCALLVDIAMLISIGVFLMRAETSFSSAFLRTTAAHPFSFVSTTIVLALVALFSFFVATIPGEALDRITQSVSGRHQDNEAGQRYAGGFAWPFMAASADGSLFGIFRRNIVVTDTDLVPDKDLTSGEPSLSLRNRDLRFARLDRSDLHQADLTGADLDDASLAGTDLRGAWLQCADVNELLLSEDRAAAKCTSAERANLSRARLDDAHMSGIDLRAAKLNDARLEQADLAYALISGADFSSAHLDKADLTGGVSGQGAQFLIASLQGADLTGAQLQGADFSSASLQGALFNYAHLQGAVLKDAQLDAGSFNQAHLQGADMTGASVPATDFRGASLWMTKVPQLEAGGVADYGDVVIKPIEENDAASLSLMIKAMPVRRVAEHLSETLAPLLDPAQTAGWNSNPDLARWQGMAQQTQTVLPDQFKVNLTEYLGKLMCRPRWSNGAIATGVARRAQTPQFKGDIVGLHDRLKDPSCQASGNVPAKVLKDFGAAADTARGS
ncbi:MAG: pentapeptide repeat-containing protein [Hyphomicrobium sp.]